MSQIKHKFNKIYSELQIKRAILLIWKVSPVYTVFVILLLLVGNACWLFNIYSLKNLIDKLVKSSASHEAALNAIILSGVAAISYILVRYITGFVNDLQSARVNQYFDREIHTHSVRLDYVYYETPEYLNIMKRAQKAGVGRPYAVVQSVLELIRNALMLVSMAVILIRIDWLLLPILAVFVLPLLAVRLQFSKSMYKLHRKNTEKDREAGYLSYLMTSDMTAKEVRTFSVGAYLLEKYNQIRVSLIAEELKHKQKRSGVETMTTVFATSAFYIVMAYVIFKSMNGGSPVGNIAIFLVIFPQSFALLQGLTNNITSLYQNNIYLNDIFEFLDLKPSIEAYDMESGTKKTPNEENIHLNNIWFKYPHAEEFVLENVSMELPAGKMIALVGLNGAGKSTLIKLLCRLYDPLDGKIMFNDTDIKDIPIADYRRQISVVFQDFVRYNMVVSENIWFGDIRQEMDMPLIKKAAIDSGAASFIEHFPDQYDTMLGRVFDDGHEVSIGQWQKIAIARALYSNSKLVILDEATSALDAIAEKELMERLRHTLGHRSALIISHRLSTIQHADHIYVMGDKKIMEEGNHESLLAKNGRYAALYKAKIEVES